jgi:uncharacterized glyoxalase superfamily protein PhnB
MKKENYFITPEQLKAIEYYKQMFEFSANQIYALSNSEKDNVAHGFELGLIYSRLKQSLMDITELNEKIKEQNIKN